MVIYLVSYILSPTQQWLIANINTLLFINVLLDITLSFYDSLLRLLVCTSFFAPIAKDGPQNLIVYQYLWTYWAINFNVFIRWGFLIRYLNPVINLSVISIDFYMD